MVNIIKSMLGNASKNQSVTYCLFDTERSENVRIIGDLVFEDEWIGDGSFPYWNKVTCIKLEGARYAIVIKDHAWSICAVYVLSADELEDNGVNNIDLTGFHNKEKRKTNALLNEYGIHAKMRKMVIR